ncbi:MAG TPA: hypothetical protein VLE95_03095, partial [Chlamydiales bacterium]|nr:hypothetical protein [Chlamydiales bacterium]
EIVQANPGAVQSIVELLSVVPGKMKALIEILNLPGSVDAVPKLLDLLKLAPDMAQKEILIDQIRYLFKRFAGTPTLPSLDEYLSKFQIMPENERFGFVSIVNELLHSHKYGPAETLDHYILAFAGCSAEERMILTNQVKLFLDNCGIDTNPYKALKFILKIPTDRRNDFIDQSSDLPKNALSHEIDLWFCFLFPGGEEQTRIDQSRAARDHIQTLDIQEQVALMLQARRLYDGLSALEANPVRAVTLLHGAEAIPEDQRETFIEQLPGLVAQVNQLQGRQNSTKLKVLLFIFRRMAPGDRADFIQHLCQLTTPYLMEHLEELLALPADQRADRVMLLSLQHQQFEDENGLPPRTLTINPADFSAEESNPTRPLLQLFEEINGHQRFPRMQYEGSDGMDVGGVTRDFVSKVFQALCHPDQKGLPLKETDNRYLPKIEEGLPQALSIDEQIKCCKAIGMLFARAINGDVSLPKGSVTTGAHFDSIMFSMIHALTLGELNSISDSLEGDSIQGIKLKLTKLYLKAQYPNMFKPEGVEENVIDEEIANLMNGVVSERLGDNGVETTFLQDFGVNSVVQATLVIAKSMHKHLISPDQWATIIGNSPEVLRTKIEGSLTADLVVNAFGLQNEAADTRKGMVKRWILEASDEALRDFVYSITGSTSLAPGQTLRVDLHESLNNPENAPVFHTCGQYMDIANYATYELLKEKLEISIASAIVGGFQLA